MKGTREGGNGGKLVLRNLSLRAFLRSLVPAFLLLTACEDTGVRPTTTVQATDSADQVLEGFSHYVTNDGVRRSRVEADTAFYYEPTQITELHNIKVVFFDIKGAEGSTLTAKKGDVSLAGRVDGGHRKRAGRITRRTPA
jgi:LPS export ABC transporter protein LptC